MGHWIADNATIYEQWIEHLQIYKLSDKRHSRYPTFLLDVNELQLDVGRNENVVICDRDTKDIVGVVIRNFGGDGDSVQWAMNILKRSMEMSKSVRVSLLITSSSDLGFFFLIINIYIVERSRKIMFARMDITTKQTMTFNEAKQRLSSLPSSEFQQAAFLSAKSRRAIQRQTAQKTKSSKTDAAEKKKVCNWCKKHGFPCEGHLWFQCQRLKEEQAKRKKQKEKDQKEKDQKGKGKADKDMKTDIKAESAHVSTEVGQQTSTGQLSSSRFSIKIKGHEHWFYQQPFAPPSGQSGSNYAQYIH